MLAVIIQLPGPDDYLEWLSRGAGDVRHVGDAWMLAVLVIEGGPLPAGVSRDGGPAADGVEEDVADDETESETDSFINDSVDENSEPVEDASEAGEADLDEQIVRRKVRRISDTDDEE